MSRLRLFKIGFLAFASIRLHMPAHSCTVQHIAAHSSTYAAHCSTCQHMPAHCSTYASCTCRSSPNTQNARHINRNLRCGTAHPAHIQFCMQINLSFVVVAVVVVQPLHVAVPCTWHAAPWHVDVGPLHLRCCKVRWQVGSR